MESIKNKLIYRFRVHDEKEFYDILELLKNRRFATQDVRGEWTEWKDSNQILNYKKKLYDFGNYDLMIRVYFNNDYNRNKFRKKVKGKIGTNICGNFDCSYTECEFHYINKNDGDIEYLWRCILNDENAMSMKD